MEFRDIHTIYFIGIGGIGMSALARYFNMHGVAVHGYDKTATDLTRALEAEGMAIHYTDDIQYIPEQVDLVIYTPAVPADHRELTWFRERNYPLKKRAEVLGIISREKKCIAIGGTHGKTTTSTMTAHLLRACGIDATAFVGGISLNLGSNFVEGRSEWVVVEADEYDRSFLHLHPDIAIVNAIDPDHLDIYGTAEAVRDAYAQFARQVKPGGLALLHEQVDLGLTTARYFGINSRNYRAYNVRVSEGSMLFDLDIKETPDLIQHTFEGLRLDYPGNHNVNNATAAIAAALAAGASPADIPAALASFRGVKRRFEYIVRKPDCIYIDDYAHHPVELEATIRAARLLYPDRKITGVFQPHLYTRTRDFADGFAEALDLLDTCILLPIYPARELPIAGVDAALIAGKMKTAEVVICEKKDLVACIVSRKPTVLLTMGAGDIDTLIEPIKNALSEHA